MSFGGGSSIQADAYRNAIPGVYGIANFNIGVVNRNLARGLDDLSKKLIRTTSTQRAQAAGTGFSVASKSFQQIQTETVDVILAKANDIRSDAELERQRIWYEAQVEAVNLENRARAAEIAQRTQNMQMLTQGISRIMGAFG